MVPLEELLIPIGMVPEVDKAEEDGHSTETVALPYVEVVAVPVLEGAPGVGAVDDSTPGADEMIVQGIDSCVSPLDARAKLEAETVEFVVACAVLVRYGLVPELVLRNTDVEGRTSVELIGAAAQVVSAVSGLVVSLPTDGMGASSDVSVHVDVVGPRVGAAVESLALYVITGLVLLAAFSLVRE